jgi:LysM repeat protein
MTVSDKIESYRKRRKNQLPLMLAGLAVLLVVIGIIIVVISLGKGGFTPFATATSTVTITSTPTITPTLTETPTITTTPTITATVTAAAIYPYVVKEGETLTSIVQSQGLADTPNALIIIFMLNPTIDSLTGFITVGQTINLPPPNYPMPTPTPYPTGLAPGASITYRVLPGDSLGSIANKFNSTVTDIVLVNKAVLTNGASSVIYPGQLLQVRINLVTPVPTVIPSATATP